MRRGQIPMYPYSYIFYWAESESKLNFCLKIVVLRSRRVVLISADDSQWRLAAAPVRKLVILSVA